MKAFKTILLLTLMSPMPCFPQSMIRGIFLNAEDFRAQKLSHASAHTHIKLHELFKKEIVEIKVHDSLFTYKKSDIFGYCDTDGNVFRFYNNTIFPILNPGETILLYKVANGAPPKGQPQTYSCYFSVDASRDILPLQINKLETEFKENKTFLKLLEVHFSTTSDLLEYDNVHKMYKLNRLLEIAKQHESD